MRARWPWPYVVLVFLTACDGRVATSASAGEDAAGAGEDAARSGGDAAATLDGLVVEAGPREGSSDAGDRMDASGSGCKAPASAGVAPEGSPPEDCLPGCLWDLFKNCLPSEECIGSASLGSEDPFGSPEIRCEPSTGWYSEGWFSGGQPGNQLSVYKDGALCYFVVWGGASPFLGKVYHEPSGEAVAGLSYDGTEAVCGFGFSNISLYPTREDCVPWISLVTPSYDCARPEDVESRCSCWAPR